MITVAIFNFLNDLQFNFNRCYNFWTNFQWFTLETLCFGLKNIEKKFEIEFIYQVNLCSLLSIEIYQIYL